MERFAALIDALVYTGSRNAKLKLIADYLRATPDPDRGWALAALTGGLDFPAVKGSTVRALLMERVDPVLFQLSRDYVGDTAETASLLWPEPEGPRAPPPTVAQAVDALSAMTRMSALRDLAALLDRLDALTNVELPLMYAGVDRSSRRERATEALTRVGLAERLHHRPTQLSGGQQQRVAVARALVNRPRMLLADEPTGALDSRTSLELMSLFQELNRDGVTVVIVTHEPDVARYAARLVRFRDGHVLSDQRQRPADAAEELAALLAGQAEPDHASARAETEAVA